MRHLSIAVVGVCAVGLAACGAGDSDTIGGPTTTLTAGASTTTLPNEAVTSSGASTAPPTVTGAVPTATPPNATPSGNAVQTTTTPPPGGVPTSTAGTTTTEAPSAGSGEDGFDSVQWGPDVPPIPGEYSAFAVDQANGLGCESIDDRASEGDSFWKLAARVCRVLRDPDEDWPDVGSVPAPPSEGNLYEQCLDRELSAMLGRALAWHDQNPGESPVVRFPGHGSHSPCQRSVYGVTATAADPAFDDGCNNIESQQVRQRPGNHVRPGPPRWEPTGDCGQHHSVCDRRDDGQRPAGVHRGSADVR